MAWQAFVDESADDKFLVYGGYIADSDQWANFSREWEALLPFGYRAKDGDFDFKMSEMALTPDRQERAAAFYRVIQRNTAGALVFLLSFEHYHQAVREAVLFDKASGDEVPNDDDVFKNPYIFLLLAGLTLFRRNRNRPEFENILPKNEPISFCFDERSDQKKIIECFEEMTKVPAMKQILGEAPRFENDRQILPLQAADFISWWVRRAHHGNPFPWLDNHEYDNKMIATKASFMTVEGIRGFLELYIYLKYGEKYELRDNI